LWVYYNADAVRHYAELQSCFNSNIPACLLVDENRGQISHFWPTVKFRGGMGETFELIYQFG